MRNDLHVTGIRLEKLSYLEKRLLIRTVFVLIDVKTERSTCSSIAQKVRVSFVACICKCQRCLSLTNSRGSRVAGPKSRSRVQSRGRGSNVAAGENDLGFKVTE